MKTLDVRSLLYAKRVKSESSGEARMFFVTEERNGYGYWIDRAGNGVYECEKFFLNKESAIEHCVDVAREYSRVLNSHL